MERSNIMMALAVMSDPDWRSNHYDPSRELSWEQLDEVADFGWQFAAMKRYLASWSNAIQRRWRESSQDRSPSPTLAPMDAK